MSIASMTGFARTNGTISLAENTVSWFWEIKSVNGKNLDVKTKLPMGFDDLSSEVKKEAGKFLNRGSVSALLEVDFGNSDKKVKINDELLDLLANKAIDLYEKHFEFLAKPSAAEILAQRGVIELEENSLSDDDLAVLKENICKDFAKACAELQKDRKKEGEKIKLALNEILQKIEAIVANIENLAEGLPEKLKEKLNALIAQYAGDVSVSEERLAQEIVLMITRADIREEIDRLKTHVKSAYNLLQADDAVGRRLDFLCQELNREANTTCSKAAEIEITNLGMELKALIEQFREQVQNIE